MQQDLKNNPDRKSYGYAVFNGEFTETRNCKLVDLPENVKSIKMSSDGFQSEVLNSDIAHAVRMRKKNAGADRLSIGKNQATHSAVIYSKKEGRPPKFATDDASAVIIEIEHVREEDEKEF